MIESNYNPCPAEAFAAPRRKLRVEGEIGVGDASHSAIGLSEAQQKAAWRHRIHVAPGRI
jgi:hypothetical protein